MSAWDDQLDREGGNTEMPPCARCEHSWEDHGISGWCKAPLPIYAQVNDWKDTCGCTHYEPMEATDFMDSEAV